MRAENVENIELHNKDTGEVLILPSANLRAFFQRLSEAHIFCMAVLEQEWENEEDGHAKFTVPPDVLNVFKEEYGNFVCLVPAKPFLNQIMNLVTNQNLEISFDRVEYFDVRKYWPERVLAANGSKFFFQKDLKYSKEHEFRIAFGNIFEEKPVIIDLKESIKVIECVETINDLVTFFEKWEIVKPPTK